MAILQLLSRFALYQVMGEGAESAVRFLGERINDESKHIVKALQRANDRAWKAMEVALAGESLWNKLDRAEDKGFRQQIRTLLDAMPLPVLTGRNEFRRKCLEELQTARKKGVLLSGSIVDAASKPGTFATHGNQAELIERERSTLKELAGTLDQGGYKNLGWLIGQEVQPGQALIVLAVRYYFRREVENNPELATSVQFTRMENLSESQATGFAQLEQALGQHSNRLDEALQDLLVITTQTRDAVLDLQSEQKKQSAQLTDIYRMLQQMMEQSQMQQRREVRPGDSRSMRGSGERQRVRELADRVHALPSNEQGPALLNALGMLQVAAGDCAEARQAFDQVAQKVGDPKARAQARYNAYQAALEQRDFAAALSCLREAVQLDAETFAPFSFSDYEPERILGAGGFGVAFLCQHAAMRRPIVVKTLRIDGLDRNVEDVFREARVLDSLDHSAIIRLRDCRFADAARTRPYLVMDYFQSTSLAEHVERRGALTPDQLLPVARAVAEGLQAAHAQNIFHRDVKPDNLLLRAEDLGPWRVKIIDFGLAVKQEVAETTVRTPVQQAATPRDNSEMAGTVDYAAPEQMGKLPGVAVGTYSDVYGFGKTCYFALLGTPEPDDGEKEALPAGWRRFLSQCTARKIETRLANFGLVLERLRELEQAPAEVIPAATPVQRQPVPIHRAVEVKPVEPLPPPVAEPVLELPPLPSRPRTQPPKSVPPRYVEPLPPPSTTPPARPAKKVGLHDVWSFGQSTEETPTEEAEQTNVLGSLFGTNAPPPTNEATPDDFDIPTLEADSDSNSPPPPPPSKKGRKGPLGGAFS